MASLSTTLAAMRRANSGSFKGQYGYRGKRGTGGTPVGAYGILDSNWRGWASAAGLHGANVRSKAAQDRVAGHVLQTYYNRYGSWELATAAWFGGTKSADSIARRGGKISNAKLARMVKGVSGFQKLPEVNNYGTRTAGAVRSAESNVNRGWTFPVAGATEWSGGSFMDKHTKGNRSHHAIDVYASSGTPIVSPVGGTIQSVRSGSKLGGTTVSVLGNDGITYYFAHMSKHAKGIERGQKIMAGHHLGAVGNTGSARGTKSHLHFSMKRGGKALNPKSFLSGAASVAGLYKDLEYAAVDEAGAMRVTSSEPVQSAAFGQTMPEQMIQTAANQIAGGDRQDPTAWIDRDVEKLEDLEVTQQAGEVA